MAMERPFPHENAARFEGLIGFTSGAEGFRPDLVEKDYFCSLVLERLCTLSDRIVFKGGTCLGKIYLDFFRLSEDLDFCIPLPYRSARGSSRYMGQGRTGACRSKAQ
jgi:predicted nucleotidyltransferase component of viral defense system